MIGLFNVKITSIKDKTHITSQVQAPSKEAAENEEYYKRKALSNKGHDISLEKYETSKFKFEATLVKEIKVL